jgi:hypothetical protein
MTGGGRGGGAEEPSCPFPLSRPCSPVKGCAAPRGGTADWTAAGGALLQVGRPGRRLRQARGEPAREGAFPRGSPPQPRSRPRRAVRRVGAAWVRRDGGAAVACRPAPAAGQVRGCVGAGAAAARGRARCRAPLRTGRCTSTTAGPCVLPWRCRGAAGTMRDFADAGEQLVLEQGRCWSWAGMGWCRSWAGMGWRWSRAGSGPPAMRPQHTLPSVAGLSHRVEPCRDPGPFREAAHTSEHALHAL